MARPEAPERAEDEAPFEFYCSDGKVLQLKSGESTKIAGNRVDPVLYFGQGGKGDKFVRFGVLELDGSHSTEGMKSKLLWGATK